MALHLYLRAYLLGICCFLGAANHHRLPRNLLFYNGGNFKVVAGAGVPCNEDNSIVWAANVQGNWALPPETTPLWKRDLSLVGNSTLNNIYLDSSKMKRIHSLGGRPAIYKALARALGGKRCMSRLICEVASGSLSFHNLGVIGELVRVTLTPGYNAESKENIPRRYWKAYYQGKEDICESFGACPTLDKLFLLYSQNHQLV